MVSELVKLTSPDDKSILGTPVIALRILLFKDDSVGRVVWETIKTSGTALLTPRSFRAMRRFVY